MSYCYFILYTILHKYVFEFPSECCWISSKEKEIIQPSN